MKISAMYSMAIVTGRILATTEVFYSVTSHKEGDFIITTITFDCVRVVLVTDKG